MKSSAILGLLVFVLSPLAALAVETSKSWTFDSESVGAVPEGFAVAKGQWTVVNDPDAPSKPNALAQTAKNSGSTFNLILCKAISVQDLDLSVKMKAVAGGEDQGGGLVWRAKDASNYYIARYNPLEDNFRVYKVVDGRRSELQSATIKHTDGWHALRVEMIGDHIQCYYDGQKKLDVKDSTFKEGGQIGLWSKADAQSHFDDLTLKGK